MNKLQKWMAAASRFEKELLAAHAGTSVETLQQVAGAYRTGELHCGIGLALRISRASLIVDTLPPLSAEDLCTTLRGL